MCHRTLSINLLFFLFIPLAFALTGGCHDRQAAGLETTAEVVSQSTGRSDDRTSDTHPVPSQTTVSDADQQPETGGSAGWLQAPDLEPILAAMQDAAATSGYTAALVRPDTGSRRVFLIVAADAVAADSLNGFFFWYVDPEPPQTGDAPLLLGLDRLFPESGRAVAVAGETYSDPAVVGLLDLSLQLMLDRHYQQGIADFILTSYRQGFAARLGDQDLPESKALQTRFGRIEVIYRHAPVNTVSFRFYGA